VNTAVKDVVIRNIYLKIETVHNYNPVQPEDHSAPPKVYGRDCMYNAGHEDGTIPPSEINARSLTALIYREYLDPGYVLPKMDKLVLADVNEPVFDRRVPGTVIYCHPGDRLHIHVLNWDTAPHSFHIHGLSYGIDSDGSWPFGTEAADGRRSDEICPGQSWTYVYDVTDEMVGAWPFHDHHMHISDYVNRGLFGGLVVLPRKGIEPPGSLKLPKELEHLLEHLCEHPQCIPGPGPHPAPHAHGGAGHGHSHGHGGGPPPKAQGHHDELEHGFGAHLGIDHHLLHEWAQLDYVHPRVEGIAHVPLFLHSMAGTGGAPAFDSPDLAPGAFYETTFGAGGTFNYRCRFHPNMQGVVNVVAGASSLAIVNIRELPVMGFDPPTVDVAPGGIVRWINAGATTHSATDNAGGMVTPCLNGRAYVGNSPTIEVTTGQKIRWYVFNLDLGMMWHNFHPHAMRWKFAGEAIDVRSIGPAESFVVETVAPEALKLPPEIAATQPPGKRPKHAKEYTLRGEFLFHCHVEMHMMQGLVGLVRTRQKVYLTDAQKAQLEAERGLPLDMGGNDCPHIHHHRCEDLSCGRWEEVPGVPEVAMMHAALLPNTTKVLYWGYTRADQSRLWDYGAGGGYSVPANQPANVAPTPGDVATSNLWSAEHAFTNTPEGKLLAHGGFSPDQAYIFNPQTLLWSRTAATAHQRFYSTTFTRADGRIVTLFGGTPAGIVSRSIEIFNPAGAGTWSAPLPLPATFNFLFYPWTYLLPGGDLFIAGPTGMTHRFNPIAPADDPTKRWPTIAGNRSTGGEKGTSVLLPLLPPNYEPRILIAGGNLAPAQQTAELMDLSAAVPAWTSLPNMNFPRPEQFTAVLLPDGTVMIAGGVFTEADGGPTEIFDPNDAAAGWRLCPSMKCKRGYHSSNILLPDGSVLMGGDPAGGGGPTPHERYYPWYFTRPRPVITNSPATVNYGATFNVQTPDPSAITQVLLIRPGAVTHGFNMSQRCVGCEIPGLTGGSVRVKAPPDGNIAPPGHYLLFIINASRVPSEARWIRLG
jgi:FtsP/CotA-like multicopper oxidase with cupredoxin domain